MPVSLEDLQAENSKILIIPVNNDSNLLQNDTANLAGISIDGKKVIIYDCESLGIHTKEHFKYTVDLLKFLQGHHRCRKVYKDYTEKEQANINRAFDHSTSTYLTTHEALDSIGWANMINLSTIRSDLKLADFILKNWAKIDVPNVLVMSQAIAYIFNKDVDTKKDFIEAVRSNTLQEFWDQIYSAADQ